MTAALAAPQMAAQVTEQNRQAQVLLAMEMTLEAAKLWPLLDVQHLDQSAPAWITAMTRLIQSYRAKSVTRGLDYYHRVRSLETGLISALPDVDVPTLPDAAAQTSMLVTGPVQAKSAIGNGVQPEQAMRTALVTSSKAAQRHVLDGGRQAVVVASRQDREAVGWIRVTDGHPCYFCAMLASRGPVYHSEQAATRASGARGNQGSGQTFHDGDMCTAAPVFSLDSPLPERNAQFADLYEQTTGGVYGKQKLIAFRRAYEGRTQSTSNS